MKVGCRRAARSRTGTMGRSMTLYWFGYAAVALMLAAFLASAQAGFVQSGGWQIGWDDSRGAGRLDVVLTWDEQPADTLTRSVLNNLDLWADQGADCDGDACGEHASRDRTARMSTGQPAKATGRLPTRSTSLSVPAR